MYQPLYPPAGQQYPGQQQAPGYEYNSQSTQYDQQYAHQPVQQLQYRHQPNGAAVRIHVVNLPICITYLLHEQQPPQQWQQQQQPSRHNIQPTPASPGYDTTQTLMVQRIDTSADTRALRAAMLGPDCDRRALIRIFSNPKFQHPYAFQQLRNSYDDWHKRNLEEDIRGKPQGDFRDALVALIRGPLDHDVSTLDKALNQRPIDVEALMDVLLCRSNADILAITEQYRYTKGKDLLDLLATMKYKFEDTVFALYCKILSTARAEDAALVNVADIDYKITALQRIIGEDADVVAEILTSAKLRSAASHKHRLPAEIQAQSEGCH